MTDFQFKSIIKMAMTIVQESTDKDAAVKNLEKLLYADNGESDNKSSKENKQ